MEQLSARSCLHLLICILVLLTIHTAPSFSAIATPVNTTTATTEATILTPPPQLPPPQPPPRLFPKTKKVCPGVHIRNDLKSFEQLQGCNIIDGPLTIALVSNSNQNRTIPFGPKDYENITFPDLIEVTDYLLFFRVQGLTSLANLFPNLSVIRGRELFSNYALIIYEMMHLQKINLPNLTDILRGSVRIESNPNLCYVSTVNWESICKHTFTQHFIKDNNARCENRCPEHCHPWRLDLKSNSDPATKIQGDIKELGAENNRSLFCWSIQDCQEPCYAEDDNALLSAPDGRCCSPQCAGGCSHSGRSDSCLVCRSVMQGKNCVSHCRQDLFEYKGQCIDEQECESMRETVRQNQCERFEDPKTMTSNLKAIRPQSGLEKHGQCQASCPAGQEEDPTNRHKCKLCDNGKCRKVCTPPLDGLEKPYMVTNVKSLRELSGCNIINASLEISMKGGKNVMNEIETVFQDVEEIRGYLKITRSYPILTLSFLRNLKAINGSQLDRGQYSLILIDNQNLQDLFVHHSLNNLTQIKIPQGTISAHLNPKLCPFKIRKLKETTTISDWDEKDVSESSNGDRETCTQTMLDVRFVQATARQALIEFENIAPKLPDKRQLLYYLINYREAPHGNITMFDGRDGCSSSNDVWTTLEEAPEISTKLECQTAPDSEVCQTKIYQRVFVNVKPATRYAIYVKTFTISREVGAVSDMVYFETAPDTPGFPRAVEGVAPTHESLVVTWLRPAKPNGKIESYIITVTRVPEEEFQYMDACNSIIDRDKITESITKLEPTQSALKPASGGNNSSNSAESAPTCPRGDLVEDAYLHSEQVTFQDEIIEIVYLKQPCQFLPRSHKRKRSIEHELSISDALNENSLPRKPIIDTALTQLVTLSKVPENSTQTTAKPQQPSSIRFDGARNNKTVANVTAQLTRPDGRHQFTIVGLSHYTKYAIEIVACHGEFKSERAKTSRSYNRCGLQALLQLRTQPIPENDRIRSEVAFTLANETSSSHMLSWRPPESPNGLVLAYRVKYKEKDSISDYSEVCMNATNFNRDRGFRMPSLRAGTTYVVRVQTVTLYQSKLWTDDFEFDIPRDSLSTWAWIMIILGITFVLLVAVASGAYWVQKKHRDDLIYASVNPDYVQYDPDEWECDKEKLKVENQIGTGSFGLVYKGQLITEKGTRDCAVKTVPPTATAKQRQDFLREASTMKQFDTFHVVKLLGVISVTTPVYVIMEYMANGDLKDYLRKQRETHEKQKKPLVDGIYLMAAQIADGMAYLASKKFVHRDLAARNCMVGENGVVKIGDFGLTRDIYQNEYYRRGTADRLPVRWMSPESLKDNIYTSSSDVWSYGIVLWEMITFSAYPYQGLSNEEVIKRVINGYRMKRPENCPDKLYKILERCWRKDEKERPSFMNIVEYLLPDTEGKLYPNCYYQKPDSNGGAGGDSIEQTTLEETVNGTESYPLLAWPSTNHRANGLVNGENHVTQRSTENNHAERGH